MTKLTDRITRISAKLRVTEPRSDRDATLVRELQALKEDMPTYPYLPAHEHGTFQRVLNLLPSEARSIPTHTRNPYMLFLEVERVQSEAGALQAVAGMLAPGGMGIVGCDAAVGSTGLAHVRRVLSLLREPEDPVQLQLQLALSLLQAPALDLTL